MDVLLEAKKRGLLIEPAALNHLKNYENPLKLLEACETHLKGGFIITHAIIDEVLNELNVSEKAGQTTSEKKTDYAPSAALVKTSLVYEEKKTGRIIGEVKDFTKYFQNRFAQLSLILKQRRSEHAIVTLSQAKKSIDRNKMRIIGMVNDCRETKNKHKLIELEDLDELIPCLVSKNDAKTLELANQVLQDDVLALDGFMSKGLFIVENIVWPDVPIRQKKLINEDVSIAFISDTHFGSKNFMQREFQKLIKFLRGETEDSEEASKIKYLILAGDIVDGVGIYPNQESELVTKDIYGQYEMFCDYFKQIPDHIQIIISTGNHDSARTAEPTPRISNEFVRQLEGKENVLFVSNPAMVLIHDLKILIYHGTSIDYVIKALPSLKNGYEQPELVGIEYLKRRHLSPVYGEKPLIPLPEDEMVIKQIPDILHFGHVHKNGYADYKGTFIVNSGTWQSRTDFQVKQGHVPTPAQLPVYNLKTGSLKVLNFVGDEQ
ncbi:MAG: DNA-directed DNA polymerase II small subunit [Candidatus Micrarchaeota archaeon]